MTMALCWLSGNATSVICRHSCGETGDFYAPIRKVCLDLIVQIAKKSSRPLERPTTYLGSRIVGHPPLHSSTMVVKNHTETYLVYSEPEEIHPCNAQSMALN